LWCGSMVVALGLEGGAEREEEEGGREARDRRIVRMRREEENVMEGMRSDARRVACQGGPLEKYESSYNMDSVDL
jgi:hypothetical protein